MSATWRVGAKKGEQMQCLGHKCHVSNDVYEDYWSHSTWCIQARVICNHPYRNATVSATAVVNLVTYVNGPLLYILCDEGKTATRARWCCDWRVVDRPGGWSAYMA